MPDMIELYITSNSSNFFSSS